MSVVLGPLLEPVHEVRRHVGDVGLDGVPRLLAGDDQLGEVLVEDVADHLDGQVRFAVEQLRGQDLGGRGLALDALPLRAQPVDVVRQLFLAGPLGRGADDHARVLGQAVLEDPLEPVAFDVGQLAGDAGHGPPGT